MNQRSFQTISGSYGTPTTFTEGRKRDLAVDSELCRRVSTVLAGVGGLVSPVEHSRKFSDFDAKFPLRACLSALKPQARRYNWNRRTSYAAGVQTHADPSNRTARMIPSDARTATRADPPSLVATGSAATGSGQTCWRSHPLYWRAAVISSPKKA
jgi:hypothetical protein